MTEQQKPKYEYDQKVYMKNFFEKHPEKKNGKIICEVCGGEFSYLNRWNHCKGKKHISAIQTNEVKSALEIEVDELRTENEELKIRLTELRLVLENPKMTEQRKQIKMNFYNSLK